jgi:hypothetical protein
MHHAYTSSDYANSTFTCLVDLALSSFMQHRQLLPTFYRNALLVSARAPPGNSHGSRIHRLSASSYTSAVVVPYPPTTMIHLATAAQAKQHRAWCMGGSECQCSISSTLSASHDEVYPPLLQPPRTAKRPLLITHPQEPCRPTLIAGSWDQVHAAFAGVPHTSAHASKRSPPAHAMRPSGMCTAAK